MRGHNHDKVQRMNRRVLGVWHDENSTVSLFLSFEFAADGGDDVVLSADHLAVFDSAHIEPI
jgi:hypothetical protein|tara:strand:- start:1984 stop:2169 length:186 start_codon:yes stop_codon:yes gene_type:complete